MATKYVVPVEFFSLQKKPDRRPSEGFVSVYLRNGAWTAMAANGNEVDMVLDRPLRGLILEGGEQRPLKSSDSVLKSFTLLQKALSSITLDGDVQGQVRYTEEGLRLDAKIAGVDLSTIVQTTQENATIASEAAAEATRAIGNVMTLVGVASDNSYVEVGLGTNMIVTEGSSPYPYVEIEFFQP